MRRTASAALAIGLAWAANTALGASYVVPLVVQTEDQALRPEICALFTALSLATGFDVQDGTGHDRPWTAAATANDGALRVALKSPEGRLRAEKTLAARDACADTIEVLTILLAAHLPLFAAETNAAPAPAASRPEAAPRPAALDAPASAIPPAPPPALQTVRLSLAPTLVVPGSRPRGLATLGAEARIEPLGVGLAVGLFGGVRVGLGYNRQALHPGTLTITELAPALIGGVEMWRAGHFTLRGGASVGVRVTDGAVSGLAQDGSARLTAAELGVLFEAVFEVAHPLALAAGVSAGRLLPRPGFAVAGKGRVFSTPEVLGAAHLGLLWSPWS
ncbi:MAG: hypothetical protein HY903_15665 [Deltaproteobacteria bacterium]|nr:hypothetical protein [Deltaproteobacteria bacterium]